MKTRNLLKICALSALLFTVSCNNDNSAELENSSTKKELMNKNSGLSKFSRSEQQKIVKDFFNNMRDVNEAGRVRGFCHDFTVHVSIGIFEVETSVTVCCTTLTMNCTPIPKHVIHRSASNPDIREFEVTSSSIYTDEDGDKVKIKEGIYKVAADDTVQFEIEEVK